jgi:hypothetical protein
MKNNQHRYYSFRQTQKELNSISKEKLLVQQSIWRLIVLARFLYFLSLVFIRYHKRF